MSNVNIQINVTEKVSPANVATIDRPDLNLTGNTLGKQQIYDAITDAQLTGVKGEATLTSTPTAWQAGDPDLYEKWDANTIGTYVNFFDNNHNPIVITANDIKDNFVQIRVKNGISSKSLSSKPLPAGFMTVPFSNTISFELDKTISRTTLSSALNYTYYGGNAILNSIKIHEIIPNGFPITFDSVFTTQIQSDIDYTKPISVMFHKPLTPNLKPLAIVVNISEIDNTVPLPQYKVNTVGGSLINSWFEWFELPGHTVDSDDCVFNIGIFVSGGVTYIVGNFTNVGGGAAQRWANFTIPESQWQANKIYQPDGVNVSGVRVKTGAIKPNQLITGNTNNHTLVQI